MDDTIFEEIAESSPIAGAMLIVAWMIVKRLDRISDGLSRLHARIDDLFVRRNGSAK